MRLEVPKEDVVEGDAPLKVFGRFEAIFVDPLHPCQDGLVEVTNGVMLLQWWR